MKTLSFIAFILLFNDINFTQGLIFQKTIDSSYSQVMNDVKIINDNTYTTVSFYELNLGPVTQLQRYDANGNLSWSKTLPYSLSQPKIINTTDNKLLVYGHGLTNCDFGPYIIYLAKFDLQGNSLWNETYEMPIFGQIYELFVSELNSGKILMATPTFFPVGTEYLYEISNQGLIFDSIPIIGPSPRFVTSLDSQSYVTVDGNKIVKFDTSGVRIDSVNFGANPLDITTNGFNNLVISTDNTIRVFDFNLTELSPINIPNTNWKKGLKFQNGKLSALGTENQFLKIVNFDISLNYLNEYSYADPAINHHLGDFELSKLITVHHTAYNSRNYQGIQLTKYDTIANFTNATTLDVAITDIIIDDYILTQVAQPNVYNLNPEVRVEIRNNSVETLHSIKVGAYRWPSTGCGEMVTRLFFDNLNLPPGGAVKLPLGFIGESMFRNYTDDIYEDLCVYVYSPNEYVDLTINDNELCETYSAGTVGVKENLDLKFEVFPNPVSNELNIRLRADYQLVEIYNNIGEKVFEGNIEGIQSTTISTESLPKGIYIVEVFGENQSRQSNKFIKH